MKYGARFSRFQTMRLGSLIEAKATRLDETGKRIRMNVKLRTPFLPDCELPEERFKLPTP